MKQISEQAKQALNNLTDQALSKGSKLTAEDERNLTIVYYSIMEVFNPKQPKVLKTGCSDCILQAKQLARNYRELTTGAEKPKDVVSNVKVVSVKDDFEGLTLADLRELYPDIKSISRTGFINKIKLR